MGPKNSEGYYLTMDYPYNDVYLWKFEIRVGLLDDYFLKHFLTGQQEYELDNEGYLEISNREGYSIERYLLTGKFRLQKPIAPISIIHFNSNKI